MPVVCAVRRILKSDSVFHATHIGQMYDIVMTYMHCVSQSHTFNSHNLHILSVRSLLVLTGISGL